MKQQPDMFEWAKEEDARALADGRTVVVVRREALAARQAHVCYGGHTPEHCHCPQPGASSKIKRARPTRTPAYQPPAEVAETLPRARQAAVDMSANTVAVLTPERLAARARLARHVEAGRQ